MDVKSTQNVTMTLDIYEQSGCRFAAFTTEESGKGERDVLVGTMYDGNRFYAVESGAHASTESNGLVFGVIQSDNTMLYVFSGHKYYFAADGSEQLDTISFSCTLTRGAGL